MASQKNIERLQQKNQESVPKIGEVIHMFILAQSAWCLSPVDRGGTKTRCFITCLLFLHVVPQWKCSDLKNINQHPVTFSLRQI